MAAGVRVSDATRPSSLFGKPRSNTPHVGSKDVPHVAGLNRCHQNFMSAPAACDGHPHRHPSVTSAVMRAHSMPRRQLHGRRRGNRHWRTLRIHRLAEVGAHAMAQRRKVVLAHLPVRRIVRHRIKYGRWRGRLLRTGGQRAAETIEGEHRMLVDAHVHAAGRGDGRRRRRPFGRRHLFGACGRQNPCQNDVPPRARRLSHACAPRLHGCAAPTAGL